MKSFLIAIPLALAVAIGSVVVIARFFSSTAAAFLILLGSAGIAAGLFAWLRRFGPRLSLSGRILVGAAVTLVVPCAAVFLWAWTTGQTANPAGGGVPSTPLDALLYAYIVALFFGLPAFCVWSIVCVVMTRRQRNASPK